MFGDTSSGDTSWDITSWDPNASAGTTAAAAYSYDPNILNGGTPIDGTGPADSGSYWQSLISTVVGYGIAKDARKSGVYPATTATGQTVYRPAPLPVSSGAVLLIVGVVAAAVLMHKG